jgi:ribosomal protein L11 methyltransferase
LKTYPALDVRTDAPDLLLAIVDDFHPTALEDLERNGSVRVFFLSSADRDAALRALASRFDLAGVDVPDEDWARRSQENLSPVTVGRITVFPNPESRPPVQRQIANLESRTPRPGAIALVIVPSMGFGTGHHATTRLCLAALQAIPLANLVVLDVGTGSGVLAIAADRLGAARAVGIDSDPDAIQSARESLALNPAVTGVRFETADLLAMPLPMADVVTANLTGALLIRSAPALLAALGAGGTLILGGLLAHERDDVCVAFAPAAVFWEQEEDGWVGLGMKVGAGCRTFNQQGSVRV